MSKKRKTNKKTQSSKIIKNAPELKTIEEVTKTVEEFADSIDNPIHHFDSEYNDIDAENYAKLTDGVEISTEVLNSPIEAEVIEHVQELTEFVDANIKNKEIGISNFDYYANVGISSADLELENTDEFENHFYPHKKLSDYEKTLEDELNEISELSNETTHNLVIKRLRKAGVPFYSNSNISAYLNDSERLELIEEATTAFETVLDALVIDHKNDPNAMDTPRRLAKMYINELMRGRYYPAPNITAFPNKHTGKDTGFGGLLVVRSEIVSMCSHHHQPVKGVAYIGIIPDETVIGLSKYTRLVQWLARRGTLQEELAEDIADGIIAATGSTNVAVFVEAIHGCCQNRGIMANDSTTQTTVLKGDFLTDGVLRKEFHDNIMFQKMGK